MRGIKFPEINIAAFRDATIDATVDLCARVAGRTEGVISPDPEFMSGYLKGRADAAAEIRHEFRKKR